MKQCAYINAWGDHLRFESVNELARYLDLPQNSVSDKLVRFAHQNRDFYFATNKRRDNVFRKQQHTKKRPLFNEAS